jgi:5-methylthioadenosine/S-adenosylhomocysteine deaminase
LSRTRIRGATIVSMDPSIGVIDSGDILVDEGKIIAIGPKLGSWAVNEIDGRNMIVLPGLINGHIHLWQTALRGVAADWTLDHYFGVLIGQVVKLKSDTNMRAAADPVSSIVLHAGVSNVDTVMVRGKLVKQHGKLLYRDIDRRLQELDRSSQRLYAGFRSHASAA